jgi:hypothetical protein
MSVIQNKRQVILENGEYIHILGTLTFKPDMLKKFQSTYGKFNPKVKEQTYEFILDDMKEIKKLYTEFYLAQGVLAKNIIAMFDTAIKLCETDLEWENKVEKIKLEHKKIKEDLKKEVIL